MSPFSIPFCKHALLGALLCNICFIHAIQCQPSPADKAKQVLQLEAKVASAETLAVHITLAPAFHVYLDKGALGNLIPISFDWGSLIKKGVLKQEPQIVSAPAGVYAEEVQAKVLRGQGRFLFQGENLAKAAGHELRVQTQICNEALGICYRPRWESLRVGRAVKKSKADQSSPKTSP